MRVFGLVALSLVTADPALAASLHAFGQLPAIDHIALSPDGARYAAEESDEAHSRIVVRATADDSIIAASSADGTKVRQLQWAGSDVLLALVSAYASVRHTGSSKDEWSQVQALDLTTRKWTRLLDHIGGTMNVVSGPPSSFIVDGRPVAVVSGVQDLGIVVVPALFRIDLIDGKTRVQDTGNSNTLEWLVGRDGAAAARADFSEKTGDWTLFVRAKGGQWAKAHSENAPIDQPELVSLNGDGSAVLVETQEGGKRSIHAVTLADAKWGPAIPGMTRDGIVLDPASDALIGTVTTGLDDIQYHFEAAADQNSWNAIAKAFSGELVRLASWSADRMTVIVEVDGLANGNGYFLVDRRARKARPLASRYPGLAAADYAVRKGIRYKAADGIEIPAYLTLPRGWPAKALPLIVLVHGGPAARDDPGFDWWAQALASRGYAVLQPQFRGSDGFGDAHLQAAYGEWGRKMQTDLSDGVAQLAKDGIVDPARVCIVGASYGGYAALAGVTLQTGIYRCASSLAGLADAQLMLAGEHPNSHAPLSAVQRYWFRFAGAKSVTDAVLGEISPAAKAARLKVPLQLIHGRDDTVVPFAQSEAMMRAVKRAGANAELVPLEGEDHWLSKSATRILMLDALVEFLERNNPPGAARPPKPAP